MLEPVSTGPRWPEENSAHSPGPRWRLRYWSIFIGQAVRDDRCGHRAAQACSMVILGFAASCLTLALTALAPSQMFSSAVAWWFVSGVTYVMGNAPLMTIIQATVPKSVAGAGVVAADGGDGARGAGWAGSGDAAWRGGRRALAVRADGACGRDHRADGLGARQP